MTTKVLVVANRTADSEELFQALKARAAETRLQVTLLVPQDTHGGQGRRLNAALDRLHAAGIEAEGMLGDTDPAIAVQEAWDPREYDEIYVATLPVGTSRWLGFDLPQRIAKMTDACVHHVEATEAHEVAPLRVG
ncbi:MAG TPA: hypothetical protein VFZ89_02535 [Solirubrobacteraceae bacterium]